MKTGSALMKAVVVGFIALIGLLSVVLIRTLTYGIKQPAITPCQPSDLDFISVQGKPLSRFQQALRFRTISWTPDTQEHGELRNFVIFLLKEFPRILASTFVETEIVANYSLLYTVTGTDPSLQPYMLAAHLDVVPAPPDNNWEHDPFKATIDNGYVYGRGAIDDKHVVMSVLEALEFMISKGKQPQRSFYIAFGHDEEVRGTRGAQVIGDILESRGIRLAFLLDEGLVVTDGIVPGAKTPVALIGTSEKGWLTVRLSVRVSGGHSSMPESESSIGILSNALARIERNPQPNRLGTGDEVATFEHAVHVLPFPLRMVIANLWLFSPLISKVLASKPSTNALIRTTTAITMFNAGVKDNVIAPYAEAILNHRIHPSDTVQQVLDYDISIVDDPRVKVEVVESKEPSPRSPHDEDSLGYQVVKTSIRQVWAEKNPAVVPSIMIANTDTHWYTRLTDSIYRFAPTYARPEDLGRYHGVNERLSIKNYEQAVNFFYHVITNADKGIPEQHKAHSEL